jgi:hypothetical protein
MKPRQFIVCMPDALGKMENYSIQIQGGSSAMDMWSKAIEKARELSGADPDTSPFSCQISSQVVHATVA